MPFKNPTELSWQYSPSIKDLPEKLGEWILYPGSFMKKLVEKGAVNPRVHLIRQNWQFPTLSEKEMLRITKRVYALIREVVIYSPNQKWMYARSVFPQHTLTGKERCLARLKNKSLGSVLFKDPNIERSPFEVICLNASMPFHQAISKEMNVSEENLWARRSTFMLKNKALLLTEVFLPDINYL